MTREHPILHEPHRGRLREAEDRLECVLRCDRLIADAVGDAALQEFWRGVKCEYQADRPGQDEPTIPARLIALQGGPDIHVGPTPVIVGRDPWCDARLDSIRVSRIHCCLTKVDTKVVVLDLGSVNGTRINGRPVELGWLGIGEELSIAHLRYRVEISRAERQHTEASWSSLPTSTEGARTGCSRARTTSRRSGPDPG